ncbi:MAG: UDP-3-O-(3-hydroxymyristoyl)glucosamine N-acyltransferase [Sedimentisphaerales bacterium]|nr:UDP-3-O-(3-hydroxymyristoyl)glucosamine N-acyltransferase [Sedimentisphaerales bacterium]
MQTNTKQLAEYLGATLIGSGTISVNGVAGIEFATSNKITFLAENKYRDKLKDSRAGAAIVPHPIDDIKIPQLVVTNVNKSLLRILQYFAPQPSPQKAGIDPSAQIHPAVKVGEDVSIGAFTVIKEGVIIDDHTVIGEGCKIGRNCKIGKNSRLDSHVILYSDCFIGNHVILQSNTVIGSVGFGYIPIDGHHQLIPHIGTVCIEDFVEIGANSCVDRAKFDVTRIGAGTKIDNLVQIAHNVTIGKCCLIAGLTGIGGSCQIGDGVIVAGQVGIREHVTVGKGTMIGAKSLVTGDLASRAQVFGIPAYEKNHSLRVASLSRRLPELYSGIRKLEKSFEEYKTVRTSSKKDRFRFNMPAMITCGLAVILMVAFVFLLQSRRLFDPDEVRVEEMVHSFQDGNDSFFITQNPLLEDLRTNEQLFIVENVDQIIEQLLTQPASNKDYFFLVSDNEIVKIKSKQGHERLFLVTEVLLRGQEYALITTEPDRSFMKL